MDYKFIGFLNCGYDSISVVAYDDSNESFRLLEASVESMNRTYDYHHFDSYLSTYSTSADPEHVRRLELISLELPSMSFGDTYLSCGDIMSCYDDNDKYYPRGNISYSTDYLVDINDVYTAIVDLINLPLIEALKQTISDYLVYVKLTDKELIETIKWLIEKKVLVLPNDLSPNRVIELNI